MRPISKTLFFSLLVFFFAFLPAIGGQSNLDSNLKDVNGKRDLLGEKGNVPIPNLRDRYSSVFNRIEPFPYTERFDHPMRRNFPYSNSKSIPLIPTEQRAMKAIVDDFLVNDDILGGCSQVNPAIARDSSGNFVITWKEDRDGNMNIYAQRYNSTGTPVGSNFKVNEVEGAIWWWSPPAIAMNGSSNFVITWEDYRGNNWDIYAQKYDSTGTPLGFNFKVNDDAGAADQRSPNIAMDGSGNFIITWRDARNDNFDIYAQRYDSSGIPINSNLKVADDVETSDLSNPAIAMNGSGNFVIGWIDNRNGNWDIYALIYDSSGNPRDTTFQVNDDTGTVSQVGLAIDMSSTGNFVITWIDMRNGMYNPDIYAKMYYSSGNPKDSNFQVNGVNGTASGETPAIAMDGTGNFVITWTDMQNGWYWYIYAQMYDSLGNPIDSNFQVNDEDGTTDYFYYAAIAVDGSGNFAITWSDYRNGNHDIYAQTYNSSGDTLGSNFKVNDDIGTASQYDPVIAMVNSCNFVITWGDARNGNSDIYAQMYNLPGTPLDTNFKVNDDAGYRPAQYYPAIAMNGYGNFVITWQDYRNNPFYADVYAQMYDSSGTPLDTNFRVNDDVEFTDQQAPAIAMDGFGNFVVSWFDNRKGNWDIYAQRFNSLGNPLYNNFKVNDDPGTTTQAYPAIAMENSGNFVITWYDWRNGSDRNIYAQRYDSSGTPIGTNFKVNDDVGAAQQFYPVIAMDGSGNFVITWEDYRNGEYPSYNSDIYAQRYNSAGTTLSSNYKVNDDVGTAFQYNPAIAMADYGRFVITWQDDRNGNPDIYAQRYTPIGYPVGKNFLVPDLLYASLSQGNPAVATNGSRVYFAWVDNRRGKGWDVYANSMYLLRGDANGDNKLNIADIVYLVSYLFKFGPEPKPELGIGDANCDGKVTLADIVYLVSYLFKSGPPPCP